MNNLSENVKLISSCGYHVITLLIFVAQFDICDINTVYSFLRLILPPQCIMSTNDFDITKSILRSRWAKDLFQQL